MKIDALLIGGSGYIGRALRSSLEARGKRWHSVQRHAVSTNETAIDVASDTAQLSTLIRELEPEAIYFLAGGPQGEAFAVNLQPFLGLRAALFAADLPRLHLTVAGSAAEYGDLGDKAATEDDRERPVSDYGIAKLAICRLALAMQSDAVTVSVARIFNVIGPGMPTSLAPARFVSEMLRARKNGAGGIVVGDMQGIRDFVSTDDVVNALLALTGRRAAGVFNVSTGVGRTMAELFHLIAKHVGVSVTPISNGQAPRAGDIRHSIGNPNKLQAAAGVCLGSDLDLVIKRLVESQERGEIPR